MDKAITQTCKVNSEEEIDYFSVPVQASKFSIIDLFKKYFNQTLEDIGLRSSKREGRSVKNQDGSVTHEMYFVFTSPVTGKSYEVPIYINGKPTDDTKQTLSLSYKYVKPEDLLNGTLPKNDSDWAIKENAATIYNTREDLSEAFSSFVEHTYADAFKGFKTKLSEDVESNQSITGSRKMKITLKKVKAGTGYDIQLSNVQASYDAADVLSDLTKLVENDEFINELEYDNPVSYDVTVSEDAFDVAEGLDVETDEYYRSCRELSYRAILDAAYVLDLDNQYMNYIASGSRMGDIQNYSTNYSWRVQEIIDSVSQMVLEEKFLLEHPINRIKRIDSSTYHSECGFVEWGEFTLTMIRDIQALISCLTLYSCNLSPDKQNLIQSWIRNWSHEIDYVLVRGDCNFN